MSDYKPRRINEESKAVLNIACKNALDRLASSDFGIQIHEPLVAYTITTVFLEEVARELGNAARSSGGEAKVDLHGFMTIAVSNRETDEAEKEGNLVPVLTAGPACKLKIKNDQATED